MEASLERLSTNDSEIEHDRVTQDASDIHRVFCSRPRLKIRTERGPFPFISLRSLTPIPMNVYSSREYESTIPGLNRTFIRRISPASHDTPPTRVLDIYQGVLQKLPGWQAYRIPLYLDGAFPFGPRYSFRFKHTIHCRRRLFFAQR